MSSTPNSDTSDSDNLSRLRNPEPLPGNPEPSLRSIATTECVQESWSEKQVAEFIGGLGGSDIWKDYQKIIKKERIDGVTILDMELDDFVGWFQNFQLQIWNSFMLFAINIVSDYGFRRSHARVIMKKIHKKVC